MTAAAGGRWVLPLTYRRPPLSLNDRHSRFAEAKIIAEVREYGGKLALTARIGHHDRVRVELHWVPSARTIVVDEENPAPTLKALCDGLVDAGVVDDDDRWRMSKLMPVIHDRVRSGPGRMWLVVVALEALPDAPPPRVKPAPRAPAARRRSTRRSGGQPGGGTWQPPRAAPAPRVAEWSKIVAANAARVRRERGGGNTGGNTGGGRGGG